ncbi:MAG TPA: hypothetical protein VK804_15855 [Bradyrhizobium sp.]|uniref:hypothetical protein n=1 Tax=Bradyrhizobium sp. TaxID=376 RepID=UPI002BCE8DC5|nr:hypothetical protein [Bradyrhizobium sp.]HTB01943.1 hypothetical protein [Bradyrhizobium sp.]
MNDPLGLANSSARYRARRVGFNRRFGVKLDALWAVESAPPPLDGDGKQFKSLIKMAGKGEIAKGDEHHIDRPGAHLG